MMEMLGPKPRWEYRKIELLNELNGDIVHEAEEHGWKLSQSYVKDMPDPDRDCDPMNVHGWIQNMLDQVEGNFASLCEEILKQDPKALTALKETAYRFGYRHAKDDRNAVSGYQLLDDVLLNGMPCDDVNEITFQSPEKTEWNEKQDMHAEYWKDESVYHTLRTEVIRGLLAKSPLIYTYESDKNHQSIVMEQKTL